MGNQTEYKEKEAKARQSPVKKEERVESEQRKALKGLSYEEQIDALKPDRPTLSETDPNNPLLKKGLGLPTPINQGKKEERDVFEGQEKKDGGLALEGTISSEGAMVEIEGKKIKVDIQVLRSPPENLTRDGVLAAVRINPKGVVSLSAGGGYLPKLYGIVPGPKAKSPEPRVLAFVSIDAGGNVLQIPAPQGCKFTLDAEGHITLAAPIDLVKDPGPLGDLGRHLDATAMLGMSNIDARMDARVQKQLSEGVSAEIGYTAFVDILFNMARYEMGGKGVPLASHVIGGSVNISGEKANVELGARVPLYAPTNRLPTEPQVSATVEPKSPYIPNLDVQAGIGKGGLHYVGLSKDFQVKSAQIGVSAGVEYPFDSAGKNFKASASLRIPIGGGGGRKEFKHNLFSNARDVDHPPMPEPKAPSLEEVFSPEEIEKLDEFVERHKGKGEPVGEKDLEYLASLIGSPERLAAFHNRYWEYDYERLSKYMGGEGLGYDRAAYSPIETLTLMKSVCCDYSALWTSLLEKQGYEAYTIAYLGADTGHVVCVYKDKDGKWNILDNGYIIPTKASTREIALQQGIPEAWCYIEYDKPRDDLRPVPIKKTETKDLQRILEFMRGKKVDEK